MASAIVVYQQANNCAEMVMEFDQKYNSRPTLALYGLPALLNLPQLPQQQKQ